MSMASDSTINEVRHFFARLRNTATSVPSKEELKLVKLVARTAKDASMTMQHANLLQLTYVLLDNLLTRKENDLFPVARTLDFLKEADDVGPLPTTTSDSVGRERVLGDIADGDSASLHKIQSLMGLLGNGQAGPSISMQLRAVGSNATRPNDGGLDPMQLIMALLENRPDAFIDSMSETTQERPNAMGHGHSGPIALPPLPALLGNGPESSPVAHPSRKRQKTNKSQNKRLSENAEFNAMVSLLASNVSKSDSMMGGNPDSNHASGDKESVDGDVNDNGMDQEWEDIEE